MNVKLIQEKVSQLFKEEKTGHGWEHIKRVVSNCQLILEELDDDNINTNIVMAAAYVHDLIDDKLFTDLIEAEYVTRKLLKDAGANAEEIEAIIDICHKQSFSANLEKAQSLTIEGQIVQDADRLDAIGAIGILRTAYYGGSKGHQLYSEEIDKNPDFKDKSSYRQTENVIQHFYDKLLKIEDLMNTEVAKTIAAQRTVYMRDFLHQLELELEGNG